MPDKTVGQIKTVGIFIGLLLAIASPIIAVDRANNSNAFASKAASDLAREAKEIALQAKKQGQDNAMDFEYFKGKLEGTIKGVEKGMDSMAINHKDGLNKMDGKIDKMEGKIDEMMQILVRFKRAGDDAK